MAKSMWTITFNYNKAVTQAAKLDDISRKIKRERNNLNDCKRLLSSVWKSDNSDAYMRKVMKVEDELAQIERELNNASSVVNTNARNTYNTEKRALEIASKQKKK